VRYAFIHEQRERGGNIWPVRAMCRTLRVSRSGFYDFVRRLGKPGPRAARRAALASKITQAYGDSRGTYGSPRVCQQLRLEGEAVSEKAVAKAMKTLALQGKSPRPRKPRTTDSGHGKPVADNVLARDFVAASPNQKWVADLTYIDTDEGWLYLAVVIDLFSRKVVGWSTADHMKADLVCEATQRALKNRNLRGNAGNDFRGDFRGRLVHHSDRGSQYVSADFQQLLNDHGITCSMSRKGNCWDNAVAESFFGTLKTELDEPFATRAIAHAKLFDYIEVFYNRQRLHSTLNYMSPATYEAMHQAV
jgi:transposase InsO family protein